MTEEPSRARAGSGAALPFLTLSPVAALYYGLLIIIGAGLTTGTLGLFVPVEHGLTFNSMLAHLLHGEFDVEPGAIGWEGYVRDGKTYAYFGVFLALLRLPLLLFGALARIDLTVLSCLVAAVTLAACQLAAIAMICRVLPPSALNRVLAGTLVVATLLSGPEIAFLRPSIYQEVVLWANAIAAGFVCCAVRGVFVRRRFSVELLTGMAILAGLCLHTRVSTAIGLYAATGLLCLRAAWLDLGKTHERRRALRRLLIPAAVLGIFAALSGVVNYERWGNPLTFADLRLNLIYHYRYPERLLVLTQHGEFNPARIGYGLLYYFLPIWAIRAPDGGFLFEGFRHRFIDVVELPPASLLISDPLLIGMAALGVALTWRSRRRAGIDVSSVGLTAAGLALPILLILVAMSMTFRYRGEFYPFLEFLACAGFFLAGTTPSPRPEAMASVRRLALTGCVVSVLGSHLALFLYDFSPLGPSGAIVRDRSVVAFYADVIALLTGAARAPPTSP